MDDERKPLVKRRRAIIAIGTAAAVSAVFLLVPVAIRMAAHRGLAAIGFTDARGGSVSAGPHHLRISGIAIGRKSSATVAVTFSPGGLIGGRLNTIDVTDTALHGVMALNGTLALDGFTMPPPSAAPAGPIALPAARVLIDRVTLDIETPAGPSRIAGAATLSPIDGSLHMSGTLTLTQGDVTATAPADFTLSPAGWSLSLTPIHIAFPAKSDATNAIDGSLSLNKSGTAAVTGEAQFAGAKLTIAGIPVRKLNLTFQTGTDGQSAMFQLVPADGGEGLDANLKNDGTGLTATMKAAFAEVGAFAKAFGRDGIAGPLQAELSLRVRTGGAQRPIEMKLGYDGAMPGGILLRRAAVTANGGFDPAANAVTLTSCGALSAESVIVAGLEFTKLGGCLGPADGPPLFTQDKSGAISLAGVFSNMTAVVPSASGAVAEIALGSLAASLRIADGHAAGFAIKADGGAINLPILGAGIRDLTVQGASAADGSVSGSLTGGFAAAAPNSQALPITGTLGGSLADGMTLALTAGSSDHLPIIKATLDGQRARLDMPATTLGQGGADLIRLIPGLATSVSKLSGSLAFNAALDWSGAAPVSHAVLTLKDIGATTPNFTVEGLDTTVSLTSLKPLATADNQSLTMKKLLVGVPLTDGRITFGLDRHQMLNIADAGWTVAGGTVGTRDQHLDLYGPDQNLGVVVKGIDLAQLLVLVDVGGLSAKGTLEGAIPIRRTKDTILVEHGFLQTSAAGQIRYDPADTPSFLQGQPGEGTAILRDALKDFHYERLSVTIDGVLGGEEKIKMSLQGSNPAVYGGSAIALNLNLSGALDSIARSSVEAYSHPAETMRRKLQKKTGDKK